MKKEDFNYMPAAGTLFLILLYFVSSYHRALLTPGEYEFALALKNTFPGISGNFLPKIPAASATLATAGMIWLTAAKFKLLHPGNAAALYLCFPPVWWVGTSASAVPVTVFFITLTAGGLFFARRAEKRSGILSGDIAAVAGAMGCAALVISPDPFFSWWSVIMAFLPVLFLTAGISLEKLDNRGLASRKINIWAIITALVMLMILALILIPPVCRFLKTPAPEWLNIYRPGERLYRPALALLIPQLWIYIVLKSERCAEKIFFFCFAVSFVLLTLPPSIPWQRFSETIHPELLASVRNDIMRNAPTFFADDTTWAATSYLLDTPVRKVGREKLDLPPALLAQAIKESLKKGHDAVVVSGRGELDPFLPAGEKSMKYTSQQNCKLILFPGEKK